jgi:hypothetical protein
MYQRLDKFAVSHPSSIVAVSLLIPVIAVLVGIVAAYLGGLIAH